MSFCFCGKTAIIDVKASLCSEHFCEFFENSVKSTIEKFQMFSKKDKLAIACSGGKDSMVLLYLLNKMKFNITAIAVDEGIESYRIFTLKFLENFCKKNKIPLKIASFKDFSGFSMDEVIKKSKTSPCRICGTWRRYLLGKLSKDFDVLITGHNLDDEAQSLLMNVINCNFSLMSRLGPVSSKSKKSNFPIKVKPFYFSFEKEIASYAFLKGLMTKFNECPNFEGSFRNFIMDCINELEKDVKGFKENFVLAFLNEKFQETENLGSLCSSCGELSSKKTCSSCSFIENLITS